MKAVLSSIHYVGDEELLLDVLVKAQRIHDVYVPSSWGMQLDQLDGWLRVREEE